MEEKFSFHCACGKTFRTQDLAVKHLEDNLGRDKVVRGHEMQAYFHGVPPTVNMDHFPRQ